ncbi:hypothetical protein CYMTET_6614 [Cymbomonas tetramitiformis]|uniref:Uncharacterized protein n=1 Tax=Cymbomonas tetramitiformis TaxID=36881 RepID=A0AAE0LHV1_9CHLO|nr:hypothetical protein CYMTET_6614 [Cymbomonas tetramitiformis]
MAGFAGSGLVVPEAGRVCRKQGGLCRKQGWLYRKQGGADVDENMRVVLNASVIRRKSVYAHWAIEILEERDARKTVEKGDATISYNDFLGLVKQGDIVSVSFQMSGAQIVSEGKDGTFEKIDLPETVVNRELNRTLIKSDVRVTVYANRQK